MIDPALAPQTVESSSDFAIVTHGFELLQRPYAADGLARVLQSAMAK